MPLDNGTHSSIAGDVGVQAEKTEMSQVEEPPGLPYPKLPFWSTVRLSYTTYFRHFADALDASWLWLMVAGAMSAAAGWQQWSWVATVIPKMTQGQRSELARPTELTVLLQLDNAVLILAGVSIAVAWHRLLILKEYPGLSGSNLVTANLWRYVLVGLALCLIMFLPAAAILIPTLHFLVPAQTGSGSPSPAFVPALIAGFVVYAAGTAIALRLCLLLPARAVGNTLLTFRQAWNRTRGNGWRLLWGFIVTMLPPLMAAQIVFVFAVGPPRPGAALGDGLVMKMTAINTIFSIYYLLILPIGIGFLSHAYRHFVDKPLEPARPGT